MRIAEAGGYPRVGYPIEVISRSTIFPVGNNAKACHRAHQAKRSIAPTRNAPPYGAIPVSARCRLLTERTFIAIGTTRLNDSCRDGTGGDGSVWSCEKCRFSNSGYIARCAACGEPAANFLFQVFVKNEVVLSVPGQLIAIDADNGTRPGLFITNFSF